jgi:hypothetical protein
MHRKHSTGCSPSRQQSSTSATQTSLEGTPNIETIDGPSNPESGRGRSRSCFDTSRSKRIRLFDNTFLENLTMTSPRVFAVIWCSVFAVATYASWRTADLAMSLGFIALGGIIWTIHEYVTHRFVFHFRISSPLWQRIVYLAHGNHHVNSNDPLRNMMLPVVSLTTNSADRGSGTPCARR